MKIRNGFVSNSSSSSFLCDVSGEMESGWDLCLSDAGMYECENGHTFKEEYLVDADDAVIEGMTSDMRYALEDLCGYVKDDDFDDNATNVANSYSVDKAELLRQYEAHNGSYYVDEDEDDDRYSIKACRCPICTMTEFNDYELVSYLIAKMGKTRKEVEDEVRKETGRDYDKYCEVINSNEEDE